MLRLMGADLVIDELDDFDLADLPAILASFSPDFMAAGREFNEQEERDWN